MNYAAHRFQIPFAALGLALLLPSPVAAKDNKQQEGEALLAKARELSDIRCEGCQAFQLKARVWTRQSGVRQLGSYSLIWASPKQWREEVLFPGSRFLTVANGKISWRAWTSEFRPVWLLNLAASLDFQRIFFPGMLRRAKKVWLRSFGDASQQCIEADFSEDYHREFCISGQLGTVTSSQDSGAFQKAHEWADYGKFGDKYFPRMVRITESGYQQTEARVDELVAEPSIELATFSPPENAVVWPVCEKPSFPTPVHKPEPPYPESMRSQKVTGTVVLLVRVESDGRVGNAYVLRSSAEEFSALALDTVKGKWTFKPATCEGVAIPSEVMVEMSFKLR